MRTIETLAVRILTVAALCIAPIQTFALTVNTNDIANDAVISSKIAPADGVSGQSTNTGSGIKTGHIQDGAVTDAKITGPISADKIATYNGVVVVHNGPANGVTTFNSISAALGAQASLIKVMPGYYNEMNPIQTGQVIIEGSGSDNTFIEAKFETNKVVLRDLTLNGVVTLLPSTDDNQISDVVINGFHENSPGIVIINWYNKAGLTTLNNVTITNTVSNIGIDMHNSSIKINNSTINGAINGIEADVRSTVTVTNSTVKGGSAAVYIVPNGYSDNRFINIVNSQLIGTPIAGAWAPVKLLSCYDNSFNPIPNQ